MSSDVRQSLITGSYTLGETIGRGHYAVVKLAKHIFTQTQVAVKVIDKLRLDDVSRTHLFQEVMCMKLVQHPNVVRLYEVIDTSTKLYLILEFADGGDMFDYLIKHANGLNESLARKYFQQICRALKFCHEMNVCHRDLKPENLVFFERQGVVKLTDFGFSNQFSPGKKLLTSCGSLAYSAPEILLGDPYDAPAVDIWSLGVILFMLVTGRPPFQEANDSETIMMILDCCYKLPPSVSIECQNLIHRMIVLEPEKRATLDEIMSDSWFEQYDNDDDDDDDEIDFIENLSDDERNLIIEQMIEGNLGERNLIVKAIEENQYNSITATYFLLAQKVFCERIQRNMKRKKRSLQSTNESFNEQIRNMISPPTNSNLSDNSLPTTRRNSFDEDSEDFSGKENLPPTTVVTPRQSIDLSIDQPLLETDEERSIVQQRVPNTNTQAMNIILEEDEYSETPFIDQTTTTTITSKQKNSVDDDEDKNSTNLSDFSSTTTGTIRSIFEHKRRPLSRSCSNSDSEDNDSTQETTRLIHRKHTRSHEFDLFNQNRERSHSNVEYPSNEISSQPSQIIVSTINENLKRRSHSSRTNSIISTSRIQTSTNANDSDISTTNSMIFITDRTRSLSNEHRIANPSQMSIASRTSIRYCTPRESTVFTKTEAPPVVRLLQQTPHHDTNEIIKTLIEHQRLQSNNQENLQSAIIIEEDICPPLISFVNMTPTKSQTIEYNHRSSSNSMFSRLKYSLIKHQRKPSNKSKQQRTCCTIL